MILSRTEALKRQLAKLEKKARGYGSGDYVVINILARDTDEIILEVKIQLASSIRRIVHE